MTPRHIKDDQKIILLDLLGRHFGRRDVEGCQQRLGVDDCEGEWRLLDVLSHG
jgi:hypothetical protein